MSTLVKIKEMLKSQKNDSTYYVPSLWLTGTGQERVLVRPDQFYTEIIDEILACSDSENNYNKSLSAIKYESHSFGGDWTLKSSIYNIFVRLTTSFDHNSDGLIGGSKEDTTLNTEGIRESGTFLKSIALLPYLKKMGVNTIHLLPITSIGNDGNKGDLGSPYAIKNAYEIESNQADTLINMSVDEQFKAFVEAAHILDMRVVLEFVFRTASKDADWIKKHPDWFYWIKKEVTDAEFTSPEFSKDELEKILKIPEGKGEYLAPHKAYKDFYSAPPKPEEIVYENGKFIAKTKDGELKIPGAFADWPPDDIQPAWGDVTYLRMYNYPYESPENYNYIAYNTIRYYDPKLASAENANKELWDMIVNIIPHYQKEFGIDGVMIDMGHALPSELKKRMIDTARKLDPDFAFWDENFRILKSSRTDGYNSVIGHTWATEVEKDGLKRTLEETTEELPLPFFGAVETHNTPRAASKKGGTLFSKQAWAVNSFLPNSIPFLHGGFELGEVMPVNTGLCFTQDELKYYSDKKLPLFYQSSYNWLSKDNVVGFVRKIAQIRQQNKDFIISTNPDTIEIIETGNENILAFRRKSLYDYTKTLTVILNTDFESSQSTEIKLDNSKKELSEKITGRIYNLQSGNLSLNLDKGEILIF